MTDKEFQNECKMLFSALSARSAQYAYLNIDKNMILLTNSTSPPPNDAHGDRLMDFSVSELALHFVELKKSDFLEKLYKYLSISPVGCYCLHVANLASLLNKHKPTELKCFENEHGDKVLCEKHRVTYEKKNVVGFPINNFHIIHELYRWKDFIYSVGTKEHAEKFPHVKEPMPKEVKLQGKVFFLEVPTEKFMRDGKPVFEDVKDKMHVMCLDGLTVVSYKEFLKKLDKPYTLDLLGWVVDDSYVMSLTLFENEDYLIRSTRPNILSMPIKNIHIDEQQLLPSGGIYE